MAPGFARTVLRFHELFPAHDVLEGDAMAELDRTVWTAPVRNLGWVAARYGLR